MKKYLILLLIGALAFSCKKSKENNNDDCSQMVCVLHAFQMDFRLVDKTTGADLVFGNNPRYTTADVKIYYDAAATNQLYISPDATAKSFHTLFGKETMYLVVGGITYKLEATFRGVDCCSSIVNTLKIDGASICTHCNEVINIPVN